VNPNIIDLLCKIRTCWGRERVVAEIAHKLGYLSPNDYDWVCQLTSEATPVSALIPTWNLETGRLEFDGKLCREIQVSIAKTIVPVLDQFQQQGWPQSVEYQFLTADPQEIYQIRKRLMADMNYIAFRVKAQKIFWEPTPA
jgi:hypothetical protein